ncbi:MAG: TRAP transporter small permease [Candidatus Contubernalis sp.]|nr:TRAP transporter small permease [Candidatus Contubernalis sp.]
MESLEKLVRGLTWRTAQIAQVALAAVMFVIVANIILREFWRPLPGTVEIVEILGAVLLALGVANCAVKKGHIAVGVLVDKLSPRKEALVESAVNFVALIFISLLAWETLYYAGQMMRRGYSTAHLLIPLHPFIYLVGFGFVMLAVVLLLESVKCLVAFSTYKGSEEE